MTSGKPIAIILIIALAGLIFASVGGVFTVEASSSFVPYTGAGGNVDLGSWNLTAAYVTGITTAEVDWADILNKPTSFTPSAHNQAWGTITDTPSSYPSAWATLSGIPSLVYNGTEYYFTGKVDWGQVQSPPATYAPSAHNHAASDINSGTFGTVYLDLSALAQNIAFTSTQTVDGVDISALLLKTTKVTDLGSIWDKTVTIAYGDTSFADQNLKSDSSPTFGYLTLNAATDNQLRLSSGRGIAWGGVLKQYAEGGDMLFTNIGALRSDVDGHDNLGTPSRRWLNGYFYGIVTAEAGVITRYDTGDYGVAWASYTPPTGTNGLILVVHNTNGAGSDREYVYSGSAWRWMALT